jgi:hypothetical protein
MQYYFDKYQSEITQFAIIRRTGILSSSLLLRSLSINMLTMSGMYGKFESFVGDLVTILDYKPLDEATHIGK